MEDRQQALLIKQDILQEEMSKELGTAKATTSERAPAPEEALPSPAAAETIHSKEAAGAEADVNKRKVEKI